MRNKSEKFHFTIFVKIGGGRDKMLQNLLKLLFGRIWPANFLKNIRNLCFCNKSEKSARQLFRKQIKWDYSVKLKMLSAFFYITQMIKPITLHCCINKNIFKLLWKYLSVTKENICMYIKLFQGLTKIKVASICFKH